MKTNTPLRALFPLILAHTPAVLGKPVGPVPTTTSNDVAPTCTAAQTISICDYPPPDYGFAAASSGKAHCQAYCEKVPPCNFAVFVAGNPYTGTGSCWTYPGLEYDPSKAESGCDHLTVFIKPECHGGSEGEEDDGSAAATASKTTPTYTCAATESPSAVALDEVCDYPPPDADCYSNCAASGGAVQCLSQCAESQDCSFVVFNALNSAGNQYRDGNCWMYTNSTYDAGLAGTCKDKPKQFVYKNDCPKPPPPPETTTSATGSAATGSSKDGSDKGGSGKDGSGKDGSGKDGSDKNGSGKDGSGGSGTAEADAASTTSSDSWAPTGLSVSHPLAIGAAVLALQAL
ncbi:hypothetical protein K4F52_003365 [Lecanicillium sp. MT-2017a]|nr:hypothetical protein K4F52_003365 [Lecanicillium sp. MT-2017a]